ncbi:MAG: hypothetical protein IPP71_22795 [Bacteroidetes bacterium]|nr:hypothetical protein [Bacteroidota bacterium]
MTSCTFNGSLEINGPGFLLKNCTFNGVTTLTKTGTTNLHCYGGNTFNETTTIANNNASGRIRLATTTGDAYLGNVEFEGTTIQVAYEGMNDFYGNIAHNGNVASDVVFDAGVGLVD